jgi:hypothetical protein
MATVLPLAFFDQACATQRLRVAQQWPDGVPITEKSVMTAYKLHMELDWLLARLFTPAARERLGNRWNKEWQRLTKAARAKRPNGEITTAGYHAIDNASRRYQAKTIVAAFKVPKNRNAQVKQLLDEVSKVKILPLSYLRTACDEQGRIAKKQWPKGIPMTKATATKAAKLGLSSVWAARTILSAAGYQQFIRDRNSIAGVYGAAFNAASWPILFTTWQQSKDNRSNLEYKHERKAA